MWSFKKKKVFPIRWEEEWEMDWIQLRNKLDNQTSRIPKKMGNELSQLRNKSNQYS